MKKQGMRGVGKTSSRKKHRKQKSSSQIDFEYKLSSIGYIKECSKILKMDAFALAAACVFFHKFYRVYKFGEYDRFDISLVCIFLASKTEESFKKIESVIKVCKTVQFRKMPKRGVNITKLSDKEYEKMRNHLMQLERLLLTAIKFDLVNRHPLTYYLRYIKPMRSCYNKKLCDTLAQKGMNFINDSYYTTIPLDFDACEIAVCCILLAYDDLRVIKGGDKEVNRGKFTFDPEPKVVLNKYFNTKRIRINSEQVRDVTVRIKRLYDKMSKRKKD